MAGPAVQVVQKIVEITQMHFLGKVVDIPIVVQRQVSVVLVVQKTVGHEERQSAVRECNRKSCDVTVDIDADAAYSHREVCVCVAVQVGDVNHEDTSLLQSTAGGRRQRSSASHRHDVDDESSCSSSSGFSSSES